MGYTQIGKELGVAEKNVRRWVKRFKEEGLKGLEEKRGKATGGKKGDLEIVQGSLQKESNI
ncbi:helix-turn-helix domain-containing protein [Bacillus sp. CDB3]|uniref:helix-turn-helix domain-containing protein n=1 Tax=Bacillus sp. CDB3 TaxID=360310 RepID=UPI00267E197C|nr:helix-turn-helix domain-containing protein [Bacillus sp. CDB3]